MKKGRLVKKGTGKSTGMKGRLVRKKSNYRKVSPRRLAKK